MLRTSRILAILLGVITPSLELYRRRHQLGDIRMFPSWFDDVLIGMLLLYGAWKTRGERSEGLIYLAVGWAFLTGMAYGSFFGQLAELSKPDPSGAPSAVIVSIKGLGLAIGVTGMLLTYAAYRRGAVHRTG